MGRGWCFETNLRFLTNNIEHFQSQLCQFCNFLATLLSSVQTYCAVGKNSLDIGQLLVIMLCCLAGNHALLNRRHGEK
jgi:hypothetical protein